VFQCASYSVDQVKRLIIQYKAELNRDHLRFFSYLGMATMAAIMLLICCCFCKKCNLFRSFLYDNCCGRIYTCQTIVNQRSQIIRENVLNRFLSQQTCSHSLRSLPAVASLEMTELNPDPVGNAQSEVLKTYKYRC
jgi:hypothetical protein